MPCLRLPFVSGLSPPPPLRPRLPKQMGVKAGHVCWREQLVKNCRLLLSLRQHPPPPPHFFSPTLARGGGSALSCYPQWNGYAGDAMCSSAHRWPATAGNPSAALLLWQTGTHGLLWATEPAHAFSPPHRSIPLGG